MGSQQYIWIYSVTFFLQEYLELQPPIISADITESVSSQPEAECCSSRHSSSSVFDDKVDDDELMNNIEKSESANLLPPPSYESVTHHTKLWRN